MRQVDIQDISLPNYIPGVSAFLFFKILIFIIKGDRVETCTRKGN